MVVVDKLSKAAHFIPIKTTYKDANIADIFLKQIFRLHGILKVIISDRDPISWSNPVDMLVLGPELLKEMELMVKQVQSNLKIVQDR